MFKEIKSDLPASLVVFFVALPLCLGIALASGAPLFSGIISGIVGGIVIGLASSSPLGVSGPAAGLAVIVFSAIETLGSWHAFLLAVVLAGVIQIIMGFMKAGAITHFFPSSVIKGMLTGIGLLIIIKQIPHALGISKAVPAGGFWSSITSGVSPAALLISTLSLCVLLLWETVLSKKHKIFKLIQGPLVVVLLGIALSSLFQIGFLNLSLLPEQIVSLPVADSFSGFFSQFSTPNFSKITDIEVWKIALVLAIVASVETLLSVEATDKIDPLKRVTSSNRELKAQGMGNIISGLIGGLPLTQVIVRSSANIAFGGKTKLSTIMHGFYLLISAVTIASFLNLIPLASLATILLLVGYKLAKPSLFKQMYKLGIEEFVPFVATVAGILMTDLLMGIGIGMIFAIYYILLNNYKNSHLVKKFESDDVNDSIKTVHHIILAEEVSFFNKSKILKSLEEIPHNSKVIIDGTTSKSINYDVIEMIHNFEMTAKSKNIVFEKLNISVQITQYNT